MAKKIEIHYNEKDYTLEYNRRSIDIMYSRWKYTPSEDMYETLIKLPLLFKGAFLMHHPNAKNAVIDEIYDGLKNKSELMNKLLEMYNEPMLALIDDEEDEGEEEKKIEWGANF